MYIMNEAIMSKSFEQLGCSKINIGLAITGKRDDGYHDIDSIFQSIRLSDSIYLLNTIP